MKQTAVEWLLDNLISEPYSESDFKHNKECWNKAEEMEKEQIISFGEWYSGMEKEKVQRAYNRYLNETTFKSE